MNEAMEIYLNIDEGKSEENEALIRRMDKLLSNFGIKYTGFKNMYTPVNSMDRDDTVFHACHVLRQADWLKDKLADILIVNRTSACPMDLIRSDHMKKPSAAKLAHYEKYFLKYKALAHGIVVDEHGQLRDGYTSYIIAKKYGYCPSVFEALAEQPVKKIVTGQHIFWDGDMWKVKSDKVYVWNYSLRDPVIPNDILMVQTEKGRAFMYVHETGYVTGKEFCNQHKEVVRHMGECFYEK